MTNKNIVLGLALAAMLPVAASAATVDELTAQLAQLQAQLAAAKGQTAPATTASCSYVFTKALKKGVSDVEVMNLQKVLNMSADTEVSATGVGSTGNETKYFGAATKAAVVKFQNKYASEILTPSGLTTGTGLVGAATRAKLNALCSTPATTTTTTTTTTGQTTGLTGTAGSVTVTTTSVDTDTQVKQGQTNKILGLKVEATDSDVNVSNIKVTIANTGDAGYTIHSTTTPTATQLTNLTKSVSSNRLPRYASKVHVYMNGTEVGSADVADFTRNSDNTYTKTIALTNAIVKKGSGNKATFHVGFDANSNLDSNDVNAQWEVAVSELRFNDATGVTMNAMTTDPSFTTYGNFVYNFADNTNYAKTFSFVKLASSGDVKLTLTAGTANPVAQNVKASESSQTKGVVLNEFRLKAEGSPLTFNNITVALNGSLNGATGDLSTMINTLYIMKGSQQLGSATINSGAALSGPVTIKLDQDYTIAKDNTDTFQITADFNKMKNAGVFTYNQGSYLTASIAGASSLNATDVNGDSVMAGNLSGSASGNQQTLYTQGVQASAFGVSMTQVTNTNAIPNGDTFNITYHLKAFGNTYYIPKNLVWLDAATAGANTMTSTSTGLTFKVLNSGNAIAGGVVGGVNATNSAVLVSQGQLNSSANSTSDGKYFIVNDGEDQTFTAAITLNPNKQTSGGVNGVYTVQLFQAGYAPDTTGAVTNAYSFAPTQNFQTGIVSGGSASISTY